MTGTSDGAHPPAETRPKRVRWLALAAVIGSVAAAGVVLQFRERAKPVLMAGLSESVRKSGRPFEARLVGFSWSAPRSVRRGAASADPLLSFQADVARVRQQTASDGSTSGRHTQALANLLASEIPHAIAGLEAVVAATPERAEAWNDLGAAYLVNAMRHDGHRDLGRALAAFDRALRRNPHLNAALFNRALVLENMGLQRHAEDAWRRALTLETDSEWAAEEQQHVGRAMAHTNASLFKDAFVRLQERAAAGDALEVRRIVAQFPQQTRAYGEAEILGDWADAVLANDVPKAAAKLMVARAIGEALVSTSEETLLHDAVRAIEETRSSHTALAEAHRLYRQARITYSKKQITDAQPLFERAAEAFRAAGSPMSLVASYYVGNTLYDQGHVDASRKTLRNVLADSRLVRYRALDAQLQWELGLCEIDRGEWHEALTDFRRGALIFRQLGERAYLGFLENLLAETYVRLSDHDGAWRHRLVAMRLLSGEEAGNRLQATLSGAVHGELLAGRSEVGLSYLALLIDESRRTSSPWLMSEAFVRRSILRARLNEPIEAARDIAEARTVAEGISDVAVRRQALAYASIGEGMLLRGSNPRHSIELFDAAQSFYGGIGSSLYLPAIHYERGRAYRQIGNTDAAARDFEQGISLLESQRATIRDAAIRGVMFDGAAPLFDEAIDLLLERGEPRRAFEYVERSRARILLETLALRVDSSAGRLISPAPSTIESIQAVLPRGATIVEHVALHDRVVAFVISSNDFTVIQRPVDRTDLARTVESFRSGLETRAELSSIMAGARTLYDLLLAPALARSPASLVIVVPDQTLQIVPWAALSDRASGKFLTEIASLDVAPSASSLVRVRALPGARSQSSILVVGNPAAEGMERLPAAEDEAKAISTMYENSSMLLGEEATLEAFLERLPRHDIIHFAGHADGTGDGSALLLAGARDSSRLSASEIAGLQLARARLVVLAACGTMIERKRHVDWTPTLSHAFLAAGAPSVIGTLWPIEDAASKSLFERLHSELAATGDAPHALKTAQLRMIGDPDPVMRHPSSWAGVQITTLVPFAGARDSLKEDR